MEHCVCLWFFWGVFSVVFVLVGLTSTSIHRGECTDSLRSRIRELESECKKLNHDMKLKEEQIRELELKAQVSQNPC